jgi:hypothetical protein
MPLGVDAAILTKQATETRTAATAAALFPPLTMNVDMYVSEPPPLVCSEVHSHTHTHTHRKAAALPWTVESGEELGMQMCVHVIVCEFSPLSS